MTVPKMLAIFLVLLIVNLASALTGIVYQLVEGAREIGISAISRLVHRPGGDRRPADRDPRGLRAGAEPQQICRLGNPVRLVRRQHLPQQHGLFRPALHLRRRPNVPLSDFVGAGSFWKGAAVLQFYWLCFAIILACIAHLLWPRGTDLALRAASRGCRTSRRAAPLAIIGLAAVAMAATGAYAYWNIKVLNRYQTSDEAENISADYERKYLKYEKLPQPAITRRRRSTSSSIRRSACSSPTAVTTSSTRPTLRSRRPRPQGDRNAECPQAERRRGASRHGRPEVRLPHLSFRQAAGARRHHAR